MHHLWYAENGLRAGISRNFELNNASLFCSTNATSTDPSSASIGIFRIKDVGDQYENGMEHLIIQQIIIALNMTRQPGSVRMAMSE